MGVSTDAILCFGIECGEEDWTPDKMLDALNAIDQVGYKVTGRRVGVQPKNETEHFMECARCGHMIDCRDLEEVFAHEQCGSGQSPSGIGGR